MRRSTGHILSVSVFAFLLLFMPARADEPAPLAAAPKGFDVRRNGIERGKLETVEYESKTLGTKRKLVIYLPPGYKKDAKYPVFYLLHGAGGNEANWTQIGRADAILDNLYADKKLVPMIVVMPNGSVGGPGVKPGTGAPGGGFEGDLVKDIIPYVDSHYPVQADAEHRAVAGLSMGGGQSMRAGLRNLDKFAWIGSYSGALRGGSSTLPDLADAGKKIRLLWISCGDTDSLMSGSKQMHDTLTEKKIAHVWHIDSGGHTWPVWKNDLYLMSQMLFREKK